MKLKVPTLEIPADDPFRNDLLGRKKNAEVLTELIRSSDEPLVLCINAPWGEGKSTFLAMWRQMLINQHFKTLYFNAWENDFSDDAFISLIGELELGIAELYLDPKNASAVHEHLKKAKKFGSSLIKRAIPTAVKMATAGLVDIDDLSDDALAQYCEKLAEEQIKQYEDSKKSVAGFKEQLSAIATKISDSDGEPQPYPLVILIDELDRCRPPYAIKVLEAVKHFFSVNNVVFILALDRQQLGHSVRTMYGFDLDVAGYLRRFIDIDFNLPAPDKGAFCKAQFGRFGLIDFFEKGQRNSERDQIEKMFSELFLALNFTLREQERSFTILSLAIRTTPENYRLWPILLVALILLKIKNPDLYREFTLRQKGPKDILDYIDSTPVGTEFLNSNYGVALEAYLVTCTSDRFTSTELTSPYEEIVRSTSSNDSEKQRAARIIRFLDSSEYRDSYDALNYLVEKIDLTSNFRS